jgi:hypothetical protein
MNKNYFAFHGRDRFCARLRQTRCKTLRHRSQRLSFQRLDKCAQKVATAAKVGRGRRLSREEDQKNAEGIKWQLLAYTRTKYAYEH